MANSFILIQVTGNKVTCIVFLEWRSHFAAYVHHFRATELEDAAGWRITQVVG